MTGTATILGLAYASSITEFTVRTGPGTNFAKAAFRGKKDTSGLTVLDVQPDSQGEKSDFGRVYQWFNLQFPDGQTGWMRGHVIGLLGDFTDYGYGIVHDLKHAYLMVRDMEKVAAMAKQKQRDEEKAAKDEKKATSEETPEETQTEQVAPIMTKTAGIAKPSGPPMATIKTSSAAYVRDAPSTFNTNRLFTVPRNTEVPILDVQTENRYQNFNWYQVEYQGQKAWIREDLVTYDGDTEPVGLPWDLYPAPMDERWWVRDFNMPPNNNPTMAQHAGWDYGAKEGELMRCGPLGGTVIVSFECTKCTPAQPNTLSQGLSLNDPSVFTDDGWGDGYGHYVIVRYDQDQLPESTKAKIAEMGFGGGAVFALYGHMADRKVMTGQELEPNQVIGSCGNTGNSEGPHLHLEVRVSPTANFTSWYSIRSGLTSPGILFKR